jgi:hypothetical protein
MGITQGHTGWTTKAQVLPDALNSLSSAFPRAYEIGGMTGPHDGPSFIYLKGITHSHLTHLDRHDQRTNQTSTQACGSAGSR